MSSHSQSLPPSSLLPPLITLKRGALFLLIAGCLIVGACFSCGCKEVSITVPDCGVFDHLVQVLEDKLNP